MEGTPPGLAIQIAKNIIAGIGRIGGGPEKGVRSEIPEAIKPYPDWPERLPPRPEAPGPPREPEDWSPRLPPREDRPELRPRNVPKWEQAEEMEKFMMNKGGRIGAQEGGLMNLGGMEKDYRNDGGFVPIGEYEKKMMYLQD